MSMTEREAYVAFNLTDQIGSVTVGELALRYGSVADAWLAYPRKVSRAGGEVDVGKELAAAESMGVDIVTPVDDGYPEILRSAQGHPLALYVKGNVWALSKPALAIVGTRRATPYGLDQAYGFGRELAGNGWSIVSGLALGIDAEAHKGALAAKGVTVGILGSALDRFYPMENRKLAQEIVASGGAVVSEFPFGKSADQRTFPQRNHVVAALARGVIAVEAPLKSGTMLTTSAAAGLGRVVMAVPGRVDSRSSAGCLALIRDGAALVRNANDVEDEMGDLFHGRSRVEGGVTGESVKPLPPPFSIEESMIMKHVRAEGIAIDELIRQTGLPAAKVNSLCMALRLKGRVRFFPGNRVATPRES